MGPEYICFSVEGKYFIFHPAKRVLVELAKLNYEALQSMSNKGYYSAAKQNLILYINSWNADRIMMENEYLLNKLDSIGEEQLYEEKGRYFDIEEYRKDAKSDSHKLCNLKIKDEKHLEQLFGMLDERAGFNNFQFMFEMIYKIFLYPEKYLMLSAETINEGIKDNRVADIDCSHCDSCELKLMCESLLNYIFVPCGYVENQDINLLRKFKQKFVKLGILNAWKRRNNKKDVNIIENSIDGENNFVRQSKETDFFFVQWHITSKCDQKCKHCYMFSEEYQSVIQNELNLQQCINIFDDINTTLRRWGLYKWRLILTGGDPILRNDFFDFLEYVSQFNIPVTILGNPYHIDMKTAKRLKRLGVVRYQLSLDGDKKIDDYLRKPGHYDATMLALNNLKSAGIQTMIMFTVSKFNQEHLIPVMELASRLEVDLFSFDHLVPTGHGEALSKYSFNCEEFKSLIEKVYKKYDDLRSNPNNKTIFSEKCNLFRLHKIKRGLEKVPNNEKVSTGCSVGWYGISILGNGDVLSCRRLPLVIGKMPNDSFEEIFVNSKIMNNFRKKENYEKCGNCDYYYICRGCMALAYADTGNPFSADPLCWL